MRTGYGGGKDRRVSRTGVWVECESGKRFLRLVGVAEGGEVAVVNMGIGTNRHGVM